MQDGAGADHERRGTGSVRRHATQLTILALVLILVVETAVSLVLLRRAEILAQYYSTTVALDAVAYPDLNHGWVAGDVWWDGGQRIRGGAIDATMNGGGAWKEQTSATSWVDPGAVAFANARCGWVLASTQATDAGTLPSHLNAILATTDGGATWKREDSRTLGTNYLLNGIACAGAKDAWAVGWVWGNANGGIVLATTDGGATWKREALTTGGGLEAVAFADTRHGWAVGDGVIIATADGGRSWRKQASVTGCHLLKVACAGATHAWAVGWDKVNHAVVFGTTDGGTTWKVVLDAGASANLSGIAFADTMHGWVVGDRGTILATTDGGRSWRPQRSGTTLDLAAVAFTDARHGLLVGDRSKGAPEEETFFGSVILRTTDGGATWKTR